MGLDEIYLPNRFIHKDLSDKSSQLLRRLSKPRILSLANKWLDHADTRPSFGDLNQEGETEQQEEEEEESAVLERFEILKSELRSLSKVSKLNMLQKITIDFWGKGLNLSQVADIDFALIQEDQSKHKWTYSTFYHSDQEFVPTVDPQSLVLAMKEALYPMFLGHVQSYHHSALSLVILRLQVFAPKSKSNSPLVAAKTMFLAFPTSSPHIIHDYGNDLYYTSLLEALRTVFSTPNESLTMKTTNEIPSKSLMAFVSLKGVSRHSASLGPWKVYADNDVDNSPLDMTTKKRSLHDHQQEEKNEESESEKRRRIANIRFTGKNEDYSSRASHTIFDVGIKHSISNEPDSGNASVTVRFEGADVSSGIYKLALEGVVEPQRMPRWLTGEYGVTSGIVEDGHFSPS